MWLARFLAALAMLAMLLGNGPSMREAAPAEAPRATSSGLRDAPIELPLPVRLELGRIVVRAEDLDEDRVLPIGEELGDDHVAGFHGRARGQ